METTSPAKSTVAAPYTVLKKLYLSNVFEFINFRSPKLTFDSIGLLKRDKLYESF